MAKLTKEQATQHAKAARLVALTRDLTEEEKEFVLHNWQEDGTTRALDGAFFTPADMAQTFSIEVAGDRIIDLCAGIGRLSWGCRDRLRSWNGQPPREFVCVEKNPAYVEVGRKILPEATWICADVLDVPNMDLGRFDTAIANPPFGRIARTGNAPRYTGAEFEYHVIDVAATLARRGTFIVPQMSAPFRYSGQPYYTEQRTAALDRFERQTGIQLEANCGIDTTTWDDEWRDAAPRTEIVTAEFEELRQPAATPAPTTRRTAPTPTATSDALF